MVEKSLTDRRVSSTVDASFLLPGTTPIRHIWYVCSLIFIPNNLYSSGQRSISFALHNVSRCASRYYGRARIFSADFLTVSLGCVVEKRV